FLALEHLHGVRDREPGLAGAGRAGAEHQRMALERADIGVLRRRARPHRALAGRVVVEQRALRDRLADGAFDVALRKIVAALDLLVQALEHAARLLAGAARTVDGDVVAALFGDHAKPALD